MSAPASARPATERGDQPRPRRFIPRSGKLRRTAPLRRAGGPIDKAARTRRKAGGKLALGRDSATREQLTVERDYVKARAQGKCELCRILGVPTIGTEFAHVIARSQGGKDDRWNALWTCHECNLAMQGAFAKGRPLVTLGYQQESRQIPTRLLPGFFVEWVRAKDKWAYRSGDYTTIATGFIPAVTT